jgi:hypothetical protein
MRKNIEEGCDLIGAKPDRDTFFLRPADLAPDFGVKLLPERVGAA